MVDPLIIREMTGKREEFFRLYSVIFQEHSPTL
jgi:hypothetical protein